MWELRNGVSGVKFPKKTCEIWFYWNLAYQEQF